jgi:hypothetical protein
MLDDERLQVLGPLCLTAAFVGAELSARALGNWPASPFLWYANLELFRCFRETPDALGGMQWLNAVGLTPPLGMALALAALIGLGVVARTRLPLAIANNFSLIYSACTLYMGFAASDPAASDPAANNLATMGSTGLAALCSQSNALAMAVLLTSILSSTISHRNYWREIFT